MPQFYQVGIRDADHQGSISLRLGNLSECNAVVLEAPPSVNSGPVFLVQDWSVDGREVLQTGSAMKKSASSSPNGLGNLQ